MKILILLGFMVTGLLSAHAQTNADVASPEIVAYDAQSIRLLGEGMGYVQGNTEYEAGIFNRKMRGKLLGDTANAVLEVSVKKQRKGFWNGLGGLVVASAGLAAAANTPVGLVVLLGGAVWYGVGIIQSTDGTEQFHQAIWLHNREVLLRAGTTNR
jgi:hypothetical protein